MWNVECGILGFGIRNTALRIRKPTSVGSRLLWQRLESRTWNLESETWNPESKTVLGSLTWGEPLEKS